MGVDVISLTNLIALAFFAALFMCIIRKYYLWVVSHMTLPLLGVMYQEGWCFESPLSSPLLVETTMSATEGGGGGRRRERKREGKIGKVCVTNTSMH